MKVKQLSSTEMRVSFSHSEKPILDYVTEQLDLVGINWEVTSNADMRPKYPDYYLAVELPLMVEILTWASEYEVANDMESIR